MQDALRALIENYCTTLARQVGEIAGHVEHMRRGPDVLAPLRPALDLVHQISGLSGTMGYAEISDCAMEFEKFMRRFDEDGRIPSADDLIKISAHFDMLAKRAAAVTPQQSTLYDADLSALTAVIQ